MRSYAAQFLVVLLLTSPLSAQEQSPAPLKVLFIGNSYTAANDLPSVVMALADAADGRKIEADRHLVGGCTFERHVKETGAIDKIREQKWDVVVLQEQSLRPVIDRNSMHEYARILAAEIKQQGAKTVFYLTWARQHIPEMQEGGDPAKSPEYVKMMFQISRAAKTTDFDSWCKQHEAGLRGGLNGAYSSLAGELGANVAPVGIAWKKALAANPPFVLHRPDKSHPNPTGTYLAACVFYATLLGKSPVGLPGKVEKGDKVLVELPGEQARRLQKIAWEMRNDKGEVASTTLQIGYDNYSYDDTLQTDWGFACVVTGPEKTILLDTGRKGDILLANFDKLGVRPDNIDVVVISHNHGDHTGGLLPFLQDNPKVSVFLPAKTPTEFVEKVQQLASETTVVAEPTEICDGAVVLGPMGDKIIEQALVIDTTKGLLIVTGCSHPGIAAIAERAKEEFERDVFMVLGGTHLLRHSEEDLKAVVGELKRLGVQKVAATHCSGDKAISMLQDAFGDDFVKVGVGRVIDIDTNWKQ